MRLLCIEEPLVMLEWYFHAAHSDPKFGGPARVMLLFVTYRAGVVYILGKYRVGIIDRPPIYLELLKQLPLLCPSRKQPWLLCIGVNRTLNG